MAWGGPNKKLWFGPDTNLFLFGHMFLEVFPMLEEPEEEDGNDSVLHHHRLWHLFCVSDLRTKRIGESFSNFSSKPGSWELYNPHWSRSPPLGRLAPQYQWTPYERHKFKYSSMSMNTFTWDKGKVHKVGQRSPQRFAGVQESSRDSSEWLPWDWSFKQQREKFAWSTWVRGSSQTYPCPPSGEARRVSFHIRTLRTKTFHRKQTCEWEILRACGNPGLRFFNRICDNLGLPSLYVYMCFCK